MSPCDPEKLPENENLLLWLSIDTEGLETVKNIKGLDFIEKNKEAINKEKKIENFIANNLKNNESCPEELIVSILSSIQETKSITKKSKWYNFTHRTIKTTLPLCASIIFCISISLLVFFSRTNDTSNKEVSTHFIHDKNIDTQKNKNDGQSHFRDILLSSFDRSLTNSDSETIQNKINSKINNVSINIKDFLNTNNDYQLIGYAEDELEGNQIIQIVFDYKGDIVKVIVIPYSSAGIDLIKPAIENGTIKDIKKVETYFISIIGNSNISTDLFQYISTKVDTEFKLEEYNDNKVITTTPTNLIENMEDNSYPETQILNAEGAINNESASSDIYETLLINSSSPI